MLDLTPILKVYARARSQRLFQQNAAQTQSQTLLKLVNQARHTRFGGDHYFSQIDSVQRYLEHVPLRRYEDFWQQYWQQKFPYLDDCTWPGRIHYFPVTSGTTSGATKYIPYSAEMEQSNTKAGIDLLVHHLNNKPNSKIFSGKNFMLGGSTDLIEQAPGIFSGDLSGISVKTLPWWARLRFFPPQKLALIKDWEEKVDRLARAVAEEDICMLGGVPSWMLIFFDKLFELYPEAQGKLKNIFPKLELMVHGGINFTPYYERFQELLAGSNAEMREVYPASEGFIAIADRGYREGLRLNLDHGIFFEFIPVEELDRPKPTRHWVGNAELGVNYALALTTCAGLWSYVIGDTVKFVDLDIPRVLITGRTSYYLSAFGEHLIADEIEAAVDHAAKLINQRVLDYSVGAVFPAGAEKLGHHLYVVEFESTPSAAQEQEFLKALDAFLNERNEDYAAHRSGGFGMKAPQLLTAPRDSFRNWMKQRGKLGGQNKVPRVINDQDLFKSLQAAVSQT